MLIDKEAAALLAQVIPTLLIFIALEGRLKKPAGEPLPLRFAHLLLRTFALFSGLAATFLCLVKVITPPGAESYLGRGGEILIIVSLGLVFSEAGILIMKALWRESDDHL